MTPYRERREAGHYLDPDNPEAKPLESTTSASLEGTTGTKGYMKTLGDKPESKSAKATKAKPGL